MRTTDTSKRFKQDFKRASRGKYRKIIAKGGELEEVISKLANDEPLDPSYHDHALHHNLEGLRECHLRHDFLLVYRYEGEDWLILEGLGSHSGILGL
ncbi:MAG: type II toxin-antitoxin system YafQ family toxin [Synergistaceae bacterium]|nr:type II toxin-antitoxin system YafQ family toxin [Synergistaceae bacterium]